MRYADKRDNARDVSSNLLTSQLGIEGQGASAKAYLTEKEVANRLAVSCKWLQKMRLAGGGIRFRKFGAAVRYCLDDVIDYEHSCVRTSTSNHNTT